MAKNRNGLKGVSIVPPATATASYSLSFTDPLTDKQRKGAIGTTDGTKAKELAVKLQDWLPTHDYAIVNSLPTELQKLLLVESPTRDLHVDLKARPMNQYTDAELDYIARIGKNGVNILELLKEVENLKGQIISLNSQLATAKRNMDAMGLSTGCPSIALQSAVDDYLSDDPMKSGTLKVKDKKQMKSWLDRFALAFPCKTLDQITPDDVCKHLADLLQGKDHETIRRIAQRINHFMGKATDFTFKAGKVKLWMRNTLIGKDKERRKKGPPLWYDWPQVQQLIAKLPKWWSDVALIQFAGGFSPKELAYLQTDKIFTDSDGVQRITVDDLNHDGKTYWTGKGENRYGHQSLHDFDGMTAQALGRLQTTATAVLIPCDNALTGYHAKKIKGDEYTKQNKLWNLEVFYKEYARLLRKAAADAGLSTKKLDGRTLRRSAGKMVLINSKFNLGIAAGFLRNTENVCRKHYASILPSDIRPPEMLKKPELKIVQTKNKAG